MIISDAYYVAKAYIVGDVPLFLWGDRGIGKSSLVRDIGGELNIPVVDLRLATQEVSDLIGIPSKEYKYSCPHCKSSNTRLLDDMMICDDCKHSDVRDAFNKIVQTVWAAPEWFPDESQPEGILFLDEMNRAQRDVRQAVFQLVLDRKLHTHKLPKGWRIVAAGNYFGAYDVAEMDEAMMSRFGHIDIETNNHAVCGFGIEKGWGSRITDFLRANSKFVMMTPEDQGETHETYMAQPDPRRWEMVDRLIKTSLSVFPQIEKGEQLIRVMLTGLIGESAAREFMKFDDMLPSFEDIIIEKIVYDDLKKKYKNESKLNGAVEKVFMEIVPFLKHRPFKKKEYESMMSFVLSADRRDSWASVIQTLMELRDSKRLQDARWCDSITSDDRMYDFYDALTKAKNIDLSK